MPGQNCPVRLIVEWLFVRPVSSSYRRRRRYQAGHRAGRNWPQRPPTARIRCPPRASSTGHPVHADGTLTIGDIVNFAGNHDNGPNLTSQCLRCGKRSGCRIGRIHAASPPFIPARASISEALPRIAAGCSANKSRQKRRRNSSAPRQQDRATTGF